MYLKRKIVVLFSAALIAVVPGPGAVKKHHAGKEPAVESTEAKPGILWREPTDIASRNLFYGAGGEKDAPHTTYKFVKEDLEGSNPKFTVEDENGVKWKVKLGEEARPEVAASRFVWAVGYFTNEDYFVKDLRVENMPTLHRGRKFVAADGSFPNVRLKRELKHEKKIGTWKWSDDPFYGSRQYNGLRVMMALINNWDLKDENNAIYEEKDQPERLFMISDLGSSFGTSGPDWPHAKAKGNLRSYEHSKFIARTKPEFVDFAEPSRPSYHWFLNPPEYFRRRGLMWIGRDIPRTDAKWMGNLLGQLSPDQIRDAFRAAGFKPNEVEGFAAVVQNRIAALKAL